MIAEQKQMVNIPALPRPTTRPAPEPAQDVVPVLRQRRPMAHRGPLPIRRVKALHENSRTPGAVLVAAFTVSLLCLYVSAYARVTAEGFELSRLKADVKKAEIQHEMLMAEESRLKLPETVGQRALALGMEKTPVQSVIVTDTGASNVTPPISVH